MKNTKSISKIVITIVLSLLMISSVYIAFANNNADVKAQPVNANAATTIPSNLLQYEWATASNGPTRTYFSSGPAPNSPSIAWKVTVPGAQAPMTAFNGLVFCLSSVQGLFYALDASTGATVYTIPYTVGLLAIGPPCNKIDNTYMTIGNACYFISNGTKAWTGPSGFSDGSSLFSGSGYIPDLKMFVDPTYGWNLSNPAVAPTLVWNRTAVENVGAGGCCYGNGVLFIGGGDYYLRAVNATTGVQLWAVPDTTAMIYGIVYNNGVIYQGGLDDNMRAWNAANGQLLWTYNPGNFYGQWASGPGYAYGIVYEHNQDIHVRN